MNDNSYTSWKEMSDMAISEQIGAFVRHHRLIQGRSQEDTAKAAGISRSTLSLMERGETVTISTLIQVLRALDLLSVMEAFQVNEEISPLALAKIQHQKRQRAPRRSNEDKKESEW